MIQVAEHGISGRGIVYPTRQKIKKDSSELMIRFEQRKRYARGKTRRIFHNQFKKWKRSMFYETLSPSLE